MAHTQAPPPSQETQWETDREGRFHALLPDVMARLQRERRVLYRTLEFVFGMDDALLEEIREALTFKQLAHDEHGKGLVRIGVPKRILAPPLPDLNP